jgi:hypothetical protein
VVSLGLSNFNFRLTGFKMFVPPPPPLLPPPMHSRSSSYSSNEGAEVKEGDVELPPLGPSKLAVGEEVTLDTAGSS